MTPSTPSDTCRLFGSLILNKVAGNFHITAGHSLMLPRDHIHISAFMFELDYSFTHRINRFSFGDPNPGIVHHLEGVKKLLIEVSNTMLTFCQSCFKHLHVLYMFLGFYNSCRLDKMWSICVLMFWRSILLPSLGCLFMVQVDAEVIVKKGMCWLYGKFGEYLANQSNWKVRRIGLAMSQ